MWSFQDDWQRIVGTTAEWLFMAQGRRVLTIRGLVGGERRAPSSFSLSAAAYAATAEVRYLESSRVINWEGEGKSQAECDWVTLGYSYG